MKLKLYSWEDGREVSCAAGQRPYGRSWTRLLKEALQEPAASQCPEHLSDIQTPAPPRTTE